VDKKVLTDKLILENITVVKRLSGYFLGFIVLAALSGAVVQASSELEELTLPVESADTWVLNGEGPSAYFGYTDPLSTLSVEEVEEGEPTLALIPETTGLLVILLWVLFFSGLVGRMRRQKKSAGEIPFN